MYKNIIPQLGVNLGRQKVEGEISWGGRRNFSLDVIYERKKKENKRRKRKERKKGKEKKLVVIP